MKTFTVLSTLSLLATLTLSGCGGDSSKSTGPSANTVPEAAPTAVPTPAPVSVSQAPVLKGWRAVRNATTVVLALDAYDAQADLYGGTFHVQVKNQPELTQFFNGRPITTLLPGANPNDPELDLFLAVFTTDGSAIPSGIPISFTVSVSDRAGHRSNTLAGTFVTEGVAGQAHGGPMPTLDVEATLGK